MIHEKFNNKCWKQNICSPNRPGVSSVTYPLSLMLSSFGPRECEFGPATWLSSCKSAQRPHLLSSCWFNHRPNFSHARGPQKYLQGFAQFDAHPFIDKVCTTLATGAIRKLAVSNTKRFARPPHQQVFPFSNPSDLNNNELLQPKLWMGIGEGVCR